MKYLLAALILIFTTGCDKEKLTETTTVSEPEVINGYILPPEPDPTLNNATLTGIDSNKNGVRDDVEREIIKKYKEPIRIELLIPYAKEHQDLFTSPINEAVINEKRMSKILDCKLYLLDKGVKIENSVKTIEDYIYNTKERVLRYLEFNKALSGGSCGSGPKDWNIDACPEGVQKIIREKE